MAQRILIVEDDVHGLNITRSLLEHRGFGVDAAADAEQALHWLEQTTYQAAIIDLSLPGLSGWELLNAIRQCCPTMPCIAVTAYHSPRVAQQTRDAGFVAYFAKPFDVEGFVDKVSQILTQQG